MKVILLQHVEGLGKAGDIKEVKTGYGLNFLLPEGLAEFATPQTIKQAERFVARRAQEFAAQETDLKAAAAALEGQAVTIKTKAEGSKLFGSVGREEIAAALNAAGKPVEAKMIVLEKPIKEVGNFSGVANFGHGIKASFGVVVEAE